MTGADGKTAITIEFDVNALPGYTDKFLAVLWQVAQHNPAPFGDRAAGELVQKIGWEIVRRWLRGVDPELWHHQGSHHYQHELLKIATYVPGDPESNQGHWVPKAGEGERAALAGEQRATAGGPDPYERAYDHEEDEP